MVALFRREKFSTQALEVDYNFRNSIVGFSNDFFLRELMFDDRKSSIFVSILTLWRPANC